MAGLIWLFQSEGGTTPVINTEVGLYPQIDVLLDLPSYNIDLSGSIVTTTTTYNSPLVSYNNGTQTYAGLTHSWIFNAPSEMYLEPSSGVIIADMGQIDFIGKTGTITTTDTTYNSSSVQYNSSTQTYGGLTGTDPAPEFYL